MDGKQVAVFASNNDLILIKAIKGKEIILRYNVLPIERFFGALSLASSLILISVFIFLL